jgi:hypothetical protein
MTLCWSKFTNNFFIIVTGTKRAATKAIATVTATATATAPKAATAIATK